MIALLPASRAIVLFIKTLDAVSLNKRRCTTRFLGQQLPKRNIEVSGVSSAYRKIDCTVFVVMNDLRRIYRKWRLDFCSFLRFAVIKQGQ
jgi:hypothetical protein